jgi:hypothetical protein
VRREENFEVLTTAIGITEPVGDLAQLLLIRSRETHIANPHSLSTVIWITNPEWQSRLDRQRNHHVAVSNKILGSRMVGFQMKTSECILLR